MSSFTRKMRLFLSNKWTLYTLFLINIIILFLSIRLSRQPGCMMDEKSLKHAPKRALANANLHCFLFIIIMSSPDGILRRTAIRETWLSRDFVKDLSIEARFIIGTKDLDSEKIAGLGSEQTIHNDLLFLTDQVDSYRALSEKLLKTFVWINDHMETTFVMKADDDSYLQLRILVPEMQRRKSLSRVYWGFFRGNSNVKRGGNWVEEKWILSDHYLPYAMGGGYIISSDLLSYITQVPDMLQLYNSEDVSLGVWLAPVKMNRIHDIRFDTEYKSKGCNNKHIVSHKQSIEDMHAKHYQLINHNRLCEKEEELAYSFQYNWNVPPSQCCKRKGNLLLEN